MELKEANLISPILLENPAKTSLDFVRLNSLFGIINITSYLA